MSEFNLKLWLKEAKKKEKDVSTIGAQLIDTHDKIKIDNNSITEAKLEDYRVDDDPKTTEQRLEAVRTESPAVTTEGQLNKNADKCRNEEASLGNVNKVEEKRLEKDPVEKQEAKSASETPIEFRIEKMDSGKDGIKLASTKTAQESADIDDFDFNVTDDNDEQRERQVVDMLDRDALDVEDPVLLSREVEDESEIDKALKEYGIDEVEDVENAEGWAEMKSELMHDPDAVEGMFKEKSDISIDPGTDDKIIAGQLTFDADDPLVRQDGSLNIDFIKAQAISYLRDAHKEFMITEDNLDISHIDMGIVKFLATPAPL